MCTSHTSLAFSRQGKHRQLWRKPCLHNARCKLCISVLRQEPQPAGLLQPGAAAGGANMYSSLCGHALQKEICPSYVLSTAQTTKHLLLHLCQAHPQHKARPTHGSRRCQTDIVAPHTSAMLRMTPQPCWHHKQVACANRHCTAQRKVAKGT